MTVLSSILIATWEVFLVASPYVLLGLAAAGLLHVLIPADRIGRWLGKPGFGATLRAACLGIPLPLCSCAVVPVTIELSRKGASREASLAFLVSTPETGVDSVLVTYGLMGPIMAVVRPLAALVTSLVAAGSSLLWHEHGNPDRSLAGGAAEGAGADGTSPRASGIRARLRLAGRYGFVQMVDEIGFWLVTGLLLSGVITAMVPEELLRGALGEGPGAHLILLVLGIPLYMCASASTPVAAALMLKGVSPGAALVFLLAGPATNASSLVVIARFFGRKFVAIYLSSVVLTSLLMGWTLDAALKRFDVAIHPTTFAAASEEPGGWMLACALLLGGLLAASAARGAWRSALREFASDLKTWRQLFVGNANRMR